MARVVGIGAIGTLNLARTDGTVVNVNLRLFAKVDSGVLAIDPHPQTAAVGIQPDALPDVAAYVAEMVHLTGQMEPEHRHGQWRRVVEVLASTFNVQTDVETLIRLPFDFVPDRELRERLS